MAVPFFSQLTNCRLKWKFMVNITVGAHNHKTSSVLTGWARYYHTFFHILYFLHATMLQQAPPMQAPPFPRRTITSFLRTRTLMSGSLLESKKKVYVHNVLT